MTNKTNLSANSELNNLSVQLENLLVSLDVRGMQYAQGCLTPGYFLRAAQTLQRNKGTVLIATGFPVLQTFETDGPVGAIALYDAFKTCGYKPILVCGDPLFTSLQKDYECIQLAVGEVFCSTKTLTEHAQNVLATHNPSLVISIERPGLTIDGTYRNMFGDDISERCARFDDFINLATCPTIAIGDGGNEIGMGNIAKELASLDIMVSTTQCDELLVADVSNWAAYGLIGLFGLLENKDLLADLNTFEILQYLSERGSVDGVTKLNTLTEDSLCHTQGAKLIQNIRRLCGFKL